MGEAFLLWTGSSRFRTPNVFVDQSAPAKLFRFYDPREERIYRRLHLVSSGAQSFFKDACRLRQEIQPSLESTTHLISHLFREIDSSLRAVLSIFTDVT